METKKTILIADTSEEFRTILADALQAEEGLEVVGQTSDGQEAIQMVQDRSPDILVMDLVLGRMDGFDVLDAVKSKPVSTLILSGFARGCMADQVAARGGDYYMMKPCRIASVVERVRLLAAQHWSEGGENPAGPATARQRMQSLLEQVGLTQVRRQKMKKLSGGMKRRAGIAQAMLNDPKILILDEPTAGLDPKERIRFRNLISELAENRLVLLSTHIVSDVEYIADQILLMKDGCWSLC